MRPQRGRRRKIEAEDLSLFGEALEDIFKRSGIVQIDVARASGIAGTTISQMKVGVRLTRFNVRRVIAGLIKIHYLTPENFEEVANNLLDLADEKPLNKEHKLDAELFEMVSNSKQPAVTNIPTEVMPASIPPNLVISYPAIEYMLALDGDNRYRVQKVLVK